LASSELVVTNAPIEVAWTADGSVGTVEVWSAYAVTPDARSDMTLVHCSAPLGAGRLTVPPLPTQGQSGTGIVTSAIAVRVQNTQLLQADGWAVQVTAASFDSGPVTTVARAADAAPSSHFDAAIPALR
jgi:hypothetical protein